MKSKASTLPTVRKYFPVAMFGGVDELFERLYRGYVAPLWRKELEIVEAIDVVQTGDGTKIHIRLPEDADASKLEATVKNGILEVNIPNIESKTQKVEVKTA